MHVVFAAEEDGTAFVDVFRLDIQDTLRPRRRQSARLYTNKRTNNIHTQSAHTAFTTKQERDGRTDLLRQKRHRKRLIKQPQLPTLTLLIVRIAKDAPIEQRPMHVRHHTPDIPRRVRALARRGRELDRVQVVRHGRVEVHRVALVEGVDLAAGGDLDVWMGEDEFAEGGVEGVAVDAVAGCED